MINEKSLKISTRFVILDAAAGKTERRIPSYPG